MFFKLKKHQVVLKGNVKAHFQSILHKGEKDASFSWAFLALLSRVATRYHTCYHLCYDTFIRVLYHFSTFC